MSVYNTIAWLIDATDPAMQLEELMNLFDESKDSTHDWVMMWAFDYVDWFMDSVQEAFEEPFEGLIDLPVTVFVPPPTPFD